MLWLMIVLLMILPSSCGSRKVDKQKQRTETAKQQEITEVKTEVKEVVKIVRDTIFIEKKVEMKAEANEQRQKQSTEKRREYYENGTLKSETENTTSESEVIHQLRLENDYLKSSVVALKEEKEHLAEELNKQEQKEESTQITEKSNKTERTAYPWYWWVLGGVIIWELLKFLWRTYRPIK